MMAYFITVEPGVPMWIQVLADLAATPSLWCHQNFYDHTSHTIT